MHAKFHGHRRRHEITQGLQFSQTDPGHTYFYFFFLFQAPFFRGPDVKSFRRTEIQQRQATQVCRVTFIRSSWRYSNLFLRTHTLHPTEPGMLNSPDISRTICRTYALTYPSSYNKNGSWPSFCGFRFLLHFISIRLFASLILFCTFHIRQGLLVAP